MKERDLLVSYLNTNPAIFRNFRNAAGIGPGVYILCDHERINFEV